MQKWKQDFHILKFRLLSDEDGITLVELLATLSILMILVLVMGSFQIFGLRHFNNQTKGASQANDLSYALTELSNQIRKESYSDLVVLAPEIEPGDPEYLIQFTNGPTYKVEDNNLIKDGVKVAEQVKELKMFRNDAEQSIKVTLTGIDQETKTKEYETTIFPRRESNVGAEN